MVANDKGHNPQHTFIDLFCGAGGLSLGFHRAGFRCVSAIDSDACAIETYRSNFKDHVVRTLITENTALERADVIIGGPPCQGFSSAGLRRAGDQRNTLIRVFAELVAKWKPRAFVFENVEGFLTVGSGNRVIDLLEPLIETGYRIHLQKINAANYGVPQHRKRVIAIGGLGWDPSFPKPTHMAFGAPGASKVYRHLSLSPTLEEALEGLPTPQSELPGNPSGHYARELSELDQRRIRLLEPGQTMRDLPPELWHESYRRRAHRRVKDGTPTERRGGAPAGVRRLHGNQPSKAITSGAISEFVHPDEDRYLTLRECARIQTFPDDFEFSGNATQCILQIGNAVPPRLAHVIANSVLHDLQSNSTSILSSVGALLTFVPTISTGLSPALQQTCKRIEERFGERHENRQLRL